MRAIPGPGSRTSAIFFISYASADRGWAEWIAWQLEEAGFTTVLQAWDFVPGSNFVVEMDRGARMASRTIAVLTPAYLSATFSAPEWGAAFAGDPEGLRRALVPVRVDECRPEGLLAQIVYIDLVGSVAPVARNALLRGVRDRLKPAVAPSFPGSAPHAWESPPAFPAAAPDAITCVLADDDAQELSILEIFLAHGGFEIVATALSGPDALAVIEAHQPRVAVLDQLMPGLTGIEVTRQVASSSPKTAVILRTGYGHEAVLLQALDAGVRGFVTKPTAVEELPRAIKVVAGGGTYVDGVMAGAFVGWEAIARRRALTSSELDVLRLLAGGLEIEQIADELALSADQVTAHVNEAARKLDADTSTHAVAEALRQTLIT